MGLFSNPAETAALRRRVSTLEGQLAAVAQHVGIDQLTSGAQALGAPPEVLRHLAVEEIERGLT